MMILLVYAKLCQKHINQNIVHLKKSIPKDLEQKLKILKLIFEAQMYPEQFLPILEKINNSDVEMVVEHFGLPLFGRKFNEMAKIYTRM